MVKELIEFAVGSYRWALAKALQGHLVTCPFLWDTRGEGYIEWDGETTFMVYIDFSNDISCLSRLDYLVKDEFDKNDWRIYEYKKTS
jgi:hypothetical protein